MIALLLAMLAQAAEPEDPPEVHPSGLFILVLLPDDVAIPIAVARVDRGYLHLEARYQYEGTGVGTLWGGTNLRLQAGEARFRLTPMIAAVFGRTWGVSPGWEFDFGWRWLGFYSEGEGLIDVQKLSNTYIYVWSEVNFFPTDFLRAGLVLQRTRAYNADMFFQPGFFVGLSDSTMGMSLYVFNLGLRPPTFTLSVSLFL